MEEKGQRALARRLFLKRLNLSLLQKKPKKIVDKWLLTNTKLSSWYFQVLIQIHPCMYDEKLR